MARDADILAELENTGDERSNGRLVYEREATVKQKVNGQDNVYKVSKK